MDHLAHFDRERIPERVVHAKGSGALGYFEVSRQLVLVLVGAQPPMHDGVIKSMVPTPLVESTRIGDQP